MSQSQADLLARASDPNAPLEDLHRLAQDYPGLRPAIAANPSTYPALLEWLGSLGDPAVNAALAARFGGADPSEAATMAIQSPRPTAQPGVGTDTAIRPGPPGRDTKVIPAQDSAQLAQDQWAAQSAQSAAAATTSMGAVGTPEPVHYSRTYTRPTSSVVPVGPAVPISPGAGAVPGAGTGAMGPQADLLSGQQDILPEEHHQSNAVLWVLTGVVVVLVAGTLTWFLTANNRKPTAVQTTSSTTQEASVPQTTATTGAGKPTPTPSATPTPTPTATPTALRYPAPATAQQLSSFTAPSGNITCRLDGDTASCTIKEYNFTAQGASCSASSKPFTSSVGKSGQATGSCSQSFSPVGVTLDYGASAKNGTVACTSDESGITCWSQITGEGFTMARNGANSTHR